MAQGAVGQICHPRAPDGSDVQFQQLPVNFKGGHVAVGRRQRRAPAHRRTVFLSARQGSLLFERRMCQSVIMVSISVCCVCVYKARQMAAIFARWQKNPEKIPEK